LRYLSHIRCFICICFYIVRHERVISPRIIHDSPYKCSYQNLKILVFRVKSVLLTLLITQKSVSKNSAATSRAASKGNTHHNDASIKPDLLPFVCDAAPSKQGKFMPGSHIPILEPEVLSHWRTDYLLILPWNIASEVVKQNAKLAETGTQFVTVVPKLEFL
jgi:hypothetical protein